MSDVRIFELGKDSDKARIIARLHIVVFSGFFLTQLGESFLTTLYQGYIEDDNSGVIVAESIKNKQILGFAAYSKDYSRFYTELKKKHIVKFALCSLGVAIKHPSFIRRLLGAFKKSNEVRRMEKYVELASIGVCSNAQGKGIGSQLVDYLVSMTNFNESEYISLETDTFNNETANRFYQKRGFEIVRKYTTAEGRIMNEYRYRQETK